MPIFRLTKTLAFPPVELAEPPGILAVGGDLSSERLLLAYASGIFPWEPGEWWSPDERCVLFPADLHVTHSLSRVLRAGRFRVTLDQCFPRVIAACSRMPRPEQPGTWIKPEMIVAYSALHDAGYAHSVEVWQDDRLAGGLYGVSLGRAFFGESMFHEVPDASKVALVTLVRWLATREFHFIDCQVRTPHLESLGAVVMPRAEFIRRLRAALEFPTCPGRWTL